MKREIILFIIGVLVGAVISTGAFYVYTTTLTNNGDSMQSQNGNPGQMPQMPNGQQPSEMPDGQNGGGQQPPQMPNGQNGMNNQQTNGNSQSNA